MRNAAALLPAAVWAGVIWIIGGLSSVPGGMDIAGLDKAAHFAMYGVLGLLAGWGWSRAGAAAGLAVLLIVLGLALGAGDEWRQGRLAERSAEVADWLADAAGVVLGFLSAVLLARRR